MNYAVKEIFYTLQGEGANAGKAAVFCRFAGCNLWSGREKDRDHAVCRFCDTDFVGTDGTSGGRFDHARELAATIDAQWPTSRGGKRFVVLTGGEPMLQIDGALIDSLHKHDFAIAVETNGTIDTPAGLDWICVSPKGAAPLRVRTGNELKVVVPQPDVDLNVLEALTFDHYFVQPMDGPRIRENTQWAVDWCMRHPMWRLSIQSHKLIGIR